jgi:transcription antitermination factor NusG
MPRLWPIAEPPKWLAHNGLCILRMYWLEGWHMSISGLSFAGPRWYAIYTEPKAEYPVQFELDALGYRTFLPELTRWVSHSRTKKVVKRPLFSRYLFVEIDPNCQSFETVRLIDGVDELLASAAQIGDPIPSALPEGFIEELISRQLKGEFDLASKQPLETGARIRIMDGRYSDMIATVISLGGRTGGEILAQLLNSRVRSRFALFSVRPA